MTRTPSLSLPSSRDGWVDRPRLAEILDGRFERRVTVLQAGAGFGKTTLLIQACAENAEDSAGIDAWFSCGPKDDRASEFGAGLRRAVRAGGGDDAVRKVCDAIWKQSPLDVALILDDVHHLQAGGTGAELLERLVYELPDNGHLVIASRRAPPFPTARLHASGELCVIDETDLAFDVDERSAFLGMRGASVAEAELTGWPAILELAASAGSDRVGAFLWEEILAGLSDERLRGLARLVSLDWIDAGAVEAFTGRRQGVAELLGDLPLTRFDAEGRAHCHGLWTAALGAVDRQWTDEEFQRALQHLAHEGRYREAVELCLGAQRDRDLASVLALLAKRAWLDLEQPAFETILSLIPAELRAAPLGRLVDGLFRMHTDPERAEPFLVSARDGLAESGDGASEMTALIALAFLSFWNVDADAMRAIEARAGEVEVPLAETLVHVSRALLEMLGQRADRAFAHLDAARGVGVDMGGADAVAAAMAYIDIGQPKRAMVEVDAAIESAGAFYRSTLLALRYDAAGLAGEVGADLIAVFDGGVPAEAAANANHATIFLSVLAFQNASLGRIDVALAHIGRASAYSDRSLGPHAATALAIARMAVHTAQGDEAAAREVIEQCLAERPARHFGALRGLPIATIVSPAARRKPGDWRAGGCYAAGLQAAAALIAWREQGDALSAAALSWDSAQTFALLLVPRLMLELALVAASQGNADAARVAEALAVDHRAVLRGLSDAEAAEVAAMAKRILRDVPARPTDRVELRVLGGFQLVRNGEVVRDASVGRERVRALFHCLVVRRSLRRDELGAAVWPELDDEAMRNNLRVNMNHVRRLLEPDRRSGEPSFFLPVEGERIALRTGDGLDIDVDLFAAKLAQAQASDASGDPRSALEDFEDALAMYRGDFLEDAMHPGWGESESTRLRADFVRSALRAAELRLGLGDFDEALSWAARALEQDELVEAAHRLRILVYQRRGDRGAAADAARTGLAALSAAGLEPDVDTLRLARRLGVAA